MTNTERFLKILKQAEKNGFNSSKHFPEEQLMEKGEVPIYIRDEIMVGIIFDHDFAKTFFGKETVIEYKIDTQTWNEEEQRLKDGSVTQTSPAWKHHIKQLALSENRLGYLEKFIKYN